MHWLAIGAGAALGACLRWWLSRFNAMHSWIPMGTLGANIIGGLLIGMALVIFLRFGNHWHPNVKLFVITGFLGGLTTFSSFSAEVFNLINTGKIIAGLMLISLHVMFTLLATAMGYFSLRLILN